MPVYQLPDDYIFPPVEHAEEDGLLAVGGDLTAGRLLNAYASGIFPWYSDGSPILWWSPDPRLVLLPGDLKVARSMRPVLRKKQFKITYDQAFPEVIRHCRHVTRPDQDGTWIDTDMENAYIQLHELGFAHSVEAWLDEKLVGGLYGIALGRCFFGESMFSHVSNASKTAFIHLVKGLEAMGFQIIDCQVRTEHLVRLGAHEIPRSEFIAIMNDSLQQETLRGNWDEMKLFEDVKVF